MKISQCGTAVCVGLTVVVAFAQSTLPRKNASFPRFTQTQGDLDRDGLPTSGAKLCVLGERDICYQMPSHSAPDSKDVVYQFGLDPHSERLALADGGSWVFFTGSFSGGGSGILERIAVLRYEGNAITGRITNLLPYIVATNVSERAMWTVPSASAYPILIRADFIWGEGENHFAKHYYMVQAWRFDPQLDHYLEVFSYKTTKKYDGGDSKRIRVLSSERQEILRRLDAK